MSTRPPFIVSSKDVPEHQHRYPNSDETCGSSRPIGKVAGLLRIGIHVMRLAPGERSSWPHAEENEEEFVYVIEGEVDAWVDGVIHPMKVGDFAAFPAGTGICHTFINNRDRDATILVGGEAGKSDNRIFYPLHPHREKERVWSEWWSDIPLEPQGDHDGMSDLLREKKAKP